MNVHLEEFFGIGFPKTLVGRVRVAMEKEKLGLMVNDLKSIVMKR
jgi:hypothetical protein